MRLTIQAHVSSLFDFTFSALEWEKLREGPHFLLTILTHLIIAWGVDFDGQKIPSLAPIKLLATGLCSTM